MPATFATQVSDLEFINRFDAELYKPALKISFEKLLKSRLPLSPVRRLCIVRSGTTPVDREDSLDNGPILLKTTDIRNRPLSSQGKYYHITDSIHQRLRKTRLMEGDVLINIVGATTDVIGRVGFVASLRNEANITQAMALLRVINGRIRPGYLFAYLTTAYAQDQVQRYARPTGQYNLNLQEVGQLVIPTIADREQTEIETLILESASAQEECYTHYSQAQQFLESELGLSDVMIDKPVGYITSLSNVALSRRLDAEHYFPVFTTLLSRLPSRIRLKRLGSLLSLCCRGKQPDYSESGLRVINSKHVQPNRIVSNSDRWAKPRVSNDIQIKSGDLLINGTGRGTLGRAAAYLESENALPDNHVTVLRTIALDPVYLAQFINCPLGQTQVELHQRGSSGQLELYPTDIRKLLVWDAPQRIQLEIRELHDKARAAELKAASLLRGAKTRVEAIIDEAIKK